MDRCWADWKSEFKYEHVSAIVIENDECFVNKWTLLTPSRVGYMEEDVLDNGRHSMNVQNDEDEKERVN